MVATKAKFYINIGLAKEAKKIDASRQNERDREDRTIHKKFLPRSKW
jgi:hypothetical protein